MERHMQHASKFDAAVTARHTWWLFAVTTYQVSSGGDCMTVQIN